MTTKSALKTYLLMGPLLALTACARSGNDGRQARTTVTALTTVTDGVTAISASCASPAGVIGRVFDDASLSSSGAFEDRIKALVSANYDPSNIGTVSGANAASTTCVTLQGQLHFDSSGSLDPAQSNLQIQIFDSYATKLATNGQEAGPYPVNFVSGKEGTMSNDGTFSVTFADSLGDVVLSGQVQQGQVRGTVSFSNFVNYRGGAGQAGTLGVFLINTSSFIK